MTRRRRPPRAPSESPLPVFVNPSAGAGGGMGRGALRALRAKGLTPQLTAVQPRELPAAVAQAVAAGARAVAVCGGDGSISAAAEALAGTACALVPVPTGTLNHFARRMGIRTVSDAARAAAHGREAAVPLGMLNGRAFINTATCGAYAAFVHRRAMLRPRLGRVLAASVSAASLLLAGAPLHVALELDGGRRRLVRDTPFVWTTVGVGGFPASHRARTGGGAGEVLEVVVARPAGVELLLKVAGHFWAAELPWTTQALWRDPRFEVLHARTVRLQMPTRVALLSFDGEPARAVPPIDFGIYPLRLRVRALAPVESIGSPL